MSDEQGWEDVRSDLVKQVGGGSIPVLYVESCKKNGLLILGHEHDGRDLDINETKSTMKHLSYLWDNSVVLDALIDGSTYKFEM